MDNNNYANTPNGCIPPPPPSSQEQNGNTGRQIYNPVLENLIDMALADGELTEKEKQVLFRKAEAQGIDLDEFEMVLDAKLYEKKKEIQPPAPPAPPVYSSAPKSNKYGDIRKCPNCGAIVESFTTRCADCGYNFVNTDANSSVATFFKKMEQIEAGRRRGTIFTAFAAHSGMDKITQQKSMLITTFPIPTTKEDILEFLAMAVPEAKKANFFKRAYIENETEERRNLRPVWRRKCEQIIMKARLSMKDDPKTLAEIENYARELKIK